MLENWPEQFSATCTTDRDDMCTEQEVQQEIDKMLSNLSHVSYFTMMPWKKILKHFFAI